MIISLQRMILKDILVLYILSPTTKMAASMWGRNSSHEPAQSKSKVKRKKSDYPLDGWAIGLRLKNYKKT
jgi:hypothetical protein